MEFCISTFSTNLNTNSRRYACHH